MRNTLSIAMAAGCLILAACSSTDPGLSISRSRSLAPQRSDTSLPDTSAPSTTPNTPTQTSTQTNANDAKVSFGPDRTPKAYDSYLNNVVADIQDFWRAEFPKVYDEPYREFSGGFYAMYPARSDTVRFCDKTITFDDIADNARYFNCGDFIAWDDYKLLPDLTSQLGTSAVATVIAHEFGHAIQQRAGILDVQRPTVVTEQQADCFAGAWSAHAAHHESSLLSFTDAEVKAGLAAMVLVRDPLDPVVGETVFQEGGHGTAFDRVGAFQHGFIGGAQACKPLIDTPLPLINLTFTSNADIANQGNMPYENLQTSVTDDLKRFWSASFAANKLTFQPPTVSSYNQNGPYPTCTGVAASQWKSNVVYCPATNSIAYDNDFAFNLYSNYGDFSIGYLLSNAWSDAVQTQLNSKLSGKNRALMNDCLTGVWTKDIIPNGTQSQAFAISPGDLDEVITTALIIDDVTGRPAVASAFDKISSFRTGVLDGMSECSKRLAAS